MTIHQLALSENTFLVILFYLATTDIDTVYFTGHIIQTLLHLREII